MVFTRARSATVRSTARANTTSKTEAFTKEKCIRE